MEPDLDLLLSGATEAADSALFVGTPAPVLTPLGSNSEASRKRPAAAAASGAPEDKRAREKKRVLRNRELARVSNERRKGRIKAMETELEDTRKTVTSLEDSIRSLEAENNDLKVLLEGKSSVL